LLLTLTTASFFSFPAISGHARNKKCSQIKSRSGGSISEIKPSAENRRAAKEIELLDRLHQSKLRTPTVD
jgi:hypothetical protein